MDKKNVEDLTFGLNCNIEVYPPWDCFHRHNEIEMSFFITEKPVVFRIGGQVFEMDSAATLLFWGTIPHQIVAIEQGVRQYYITIPPYVFLSWDLPDSLSHNILNGTIIMEKDEALRRIDIASFPVWMKEAADTEDLQRRIALNRSLEARIRRFGGSAQPVMRTFARKSAAPAGVPVKANKAFLYMLDYINQNYTNDIRVDDIAKSAGLHPNYAIALFRKESGINITDYILMLRVYEAQRLLLTSEMKIVDIAMEVGFGTMSNFYKYFKKNFLLLGDKGRFDVAPGAGHRVKKSEKRRKREALYAVTSPADPPTALLLCDPRVFPVIPGVFAAYFFEILVEIAHGTKPHLHGYIDDFHVRSKKEPLRLIDPQHENIIGDVDAAFLAEKSYRVIGVKARAFRDIVDPYVIRIVLVNVIEYI
jgi:AraC-like DNA-binding protein